MDDAISIAKNEVTNAVDIVLDDVGKFSTSTWNDAKGTAVKGWEDTKKAYEDTKKDIERITNNIGKEGICAAYATMQCTK